MSEVIAALLGGVIALGIYFAIIETLNIIGQRRFLKLIAEHEKEHIGWKYDPWTGEDWMMGNKRGDLK